MTAYRIDLPLHLPISMNSRAHWRVKAKENAAVRAHAGWIASLQIPPLEHAEVWLHYAPRDARRRDADNLVATLKPACDGLVDGGVVPDDTPAYMTKHMPIIDDPDRDPTRTSRLYLIVQGDPA